MFNVGGGEILVILLLALLVLGPDKLPGAARSAGKVMRQVRDISSGFQNEIRKAMADDERTGAERAAPDLHPGAGAGPSLPPAADPAADAATAGAGAPAGNGGTDAGGDPRGASGGGDPTWRSDGPPSSFT